MAPQEGQTYQDVLQGYIAYYTILANASEAAGMGLCVVIYGEDGYDASTIRHLFTVHTGAAEQPWGAAS